MYYLDIRLLSQDFDSYFSKQMFDKNVPEQLEMKTKSTKKKKYIPQIAEASTHEFQRTKNKKRKNKK